jgi:hypothetical protein
MGRRADQDRGGTADQQQGHGEQRHRAIAPVSATGALSHCGGLPVGGLTGQA